MWVLVLPLLILVLNTITKITRIVPYLHDLPEVGSAQLHAVKVYHHHWVARPSMSIAVSTNWRHFERSCACLHAELRPRLCCRRSSAMVWSQVRLGWPLPTTKMYQQVLRNSDFTKLWCIWFKPKFHHLKYGCTEYRFRAIRPNTNSSTPKQFKKFHHATCT